MVDPARVILDPLPQRGIGDVADAMGRIEPQPAQRIFVAVDQHQPLGALPGQPGRASRTDPGRCSGDEYGLAGEIEIACHRARLSALGRIA